MNTEQFRAAYDRAYNVDPETRRRLAQIKRLFDCINADEVFRAALVSSQDSAALARSRGCEADPEDLRPLFDPDCSEKARVRAERSSSYQLWRTFTLAKVQFLDISRKATEIGAPPEFLAWRRRQIRRFESQVGRVGTANPHAVAAIELSRGCTVGCKFCGVSAKPFGGHLAYDADGATFWRNLLSDLRDVLGASSQAAFCYWATDPLDNPDYLQFIRDFRQIIGITPAMTTAIPLRNLSLTRAVLEHTAQDRTGVSRFSILSMNVFNRVIRTFTPEEMLTVELAHQAPQAGRARAFAGRNRNPGEVPELDAATTIACVSGFLINALDRTVQLVSPTIASDQWPDGFIILGQRTFGSDGHIAGALYELIDEHMTSVVQSADVLRLRADLTYEQRGAGFALRNPRTIHSYPAYGQFMSRLLADGGSVGSAVATATTEGLEPAEAFAVVEGLYNAGLLERRQL